MYFRRKSLASVYLKERLTLAELYTTILGPVMIGKRICMSSSLIWHSPLTLSDVLVHVTDRLFRAVGCRQIDAG